MTPREQAKTLLDQLSDEQSLTALQLIQLMIDNPSFELEDVLMLQGGQLKQLSQDADGDLTDMDDWQAYLDGV